MEDVRCICGSYVKSRLYDSVKFQGMNIVQCHNCNLVYSTPRYNKNEMYAHLYKNWIGSSWFKKVDNEDERFKEREEDARYEMELIYKVLGNNKGLKIFDVGFNGGTFMQVARDEYQAEVAGNDLSHTSMKMAEERNKLTNLHFGDLEDLQLQNNYPDYFDVIVFWNTLEHTHNPYLQLAVANKMMKKGGLLVIEVPDAQNEDWVKLDESPWHIYYFTKETLKNVLEAAGFEVKWFKEYEKEGNPTLDLVAVKK